MECLREFEESRSDADLDELTNGHDLFEKIYVEAKAVKKSNFPKDKFFRRLRDAYHMDGFVTTKLYQRLKEKEIQLGMQLF